MTHTSYKQTNECTNPDVCDESITLRCKLLNVDTVLLEDTCLMQRDAMEQACEVIHFIDIQFFVQFATSYFTQ